MCTRLKNATELRPRGTVHWQPFFPFSFRAELRSPPKNPSMVPHRVYFIDCFDHPAPQNVPSWGSYGVSGEWTRTCAKRNPKHASVVVPRWRFGAGTTNDHGTTFTFADDVDVHPTEKIWCSFIEETGPKQTSCLKCCPDTKKSCCPDTISARNVCFAFVYWYLGL